MRFPMVTASYEVIQAQVFSQEKLLATTRRAQRTMEATLAIFEW